VPQDGIGTAAVVSQDGVGTAVAAAVKRDVRVGVQATFWGDITQVYQSLASEARTIATATPERP
jgi:hypothetical protein